MVEIGGGLLVHYRKETGSERRVSFGDSAGQRCGKIRLLRQLLIIPSLVMLGWVGEGDNVPPACIVLFPVGDALANFIGNRNKKLVAL